MSGGHSKKKLSAPTVKALKEPGYYRDNGDGAVRGLYLQVMTSRIGTLSKSWVFRFVSPTSGKARWMGLGSAADIGLADARALAAEARRLKALRIDPIDEREKTRVAARVEAAKAVHFKEAAERYIAAQADAWRNEKHKAQWSATLKTYAYPVFGDLPVASIDEGHVLKVLEPIWTLKHETASRVRQRIESVLDWATAHKFRKGDNPARLRGHLDKVLPKISKVRRVRHHPALPYDEIQSFMSELRGRESISARALEFTVLTAARTNEVVGATWDEIDLLEKVWTVPGQRMKGGIEHKVPLCERAIEILQNLPREKNNPHVFIGARARAGLSNMALLECLRDLRDGITVHGFRSTFRDWAAEVTNFPNHVVEKALAHVIADKVEKAYRRGDLFNHRRRLMDAWSRQCNNMLVAEDNILPLHASA